MMAKRWLAAVPVLCAATGFGGTTTWTNGGGDFRWETESNWSDGVPGEADTACFADSYLAQNDVITLNASTKIAKLSVATSVIFAITNGTTSVVLSVGAMESVGSGVKKNTVYSIWPKINLFCPTNETGDCEWNVTGWPGPALKNDQTAECADIKFLKTGSGELRLDYSGVTLTDAVVIREGTLNANTNAAVSGTLVVGGGETHAQLSTVKYALKNGKPYVYTNGYARIFADNSNTCPQEYYVYEGGEIYEYGMNSSRIYLWGGKFTGGTLYKGSSTQTVRSYASDLMAIFSAPMQFNIGYYFILNVEDGARAVDLFIGDQFLAKDATTVWNKKTYFKKDLAGTALSVADMPNLRYPVYIWNGRWIVDNPGSCGLGSHTNFVQNGGILSGTGHLGGAPDANVIVSGKSTAISAVAPGSVNTNDESRIFGTLTVGTAEQANFVNFGNWSRFEVGFGEGAAHDALKVFGSVTVDAANTALKVVVPGDVSKVKGGDYEVLTASEGIVGTFASVETPQKGVRVRYSDDGKSVIVSFPTPGISLTLR